MSAQTFPGARGGQAAARTPPDRARLLRRALGWAAAAALWGLAWTGATQLDHHTDLANQAMLFVIAPVVASIWLSAPAAFAFALFCTISFDWGFVPPRGTWQIDHERHAVLLAAMLVVSWLIAGLLARLRAQAAAARDAARWAARLQSVGEALRDSADPLQQAEPVAQVLSELGGRPAALLVLRDEMPPTDQPEAAWQHGELDADERAGLWLSLRQSQAFGPGTGRHGEQPAWYLPLRSRGASYGAALVRLAEPAHASDVGRMRAQALCDLLGVALQRAALARQTEAARGLAQTQGVRNALLASISHDYRTPLAVILGAASSLQDQGERLSAVQRARLAAQIVEEVEQLSRMTDNTLQLARLDAPGVTLRLDWESAEEVVGTALAHARRRADSKRLRARLEPGLPLLRCDAMLLSQLLDNLIDNALKYSEGPVELVVRQQLPLPGETDASGAAVGPHVVLAVRDRGAGVAPAERTKVFEVFQRGDGAGQARGAGVGLAVCRAIARAHGGELKLRTRAHGGSSFELWLPVVPMPIEAQT
ncbi:ATP-binding protein [Ideonella sp. DXS29W]|uniref:histidine kinase n=1 Tax=Ideonella lacteola TaxID=2984193 RepID=A0ABU9BKY0_9BURK